MINFADLLWKQRRSLSEQPLVQEGDVSDIADNSGELSEVPQESVDLRHENRIVLLNEPQSSGADRFRLLRMRLRELNQAHNLRRWMITSPMPEDGKTTVALNLSTALAEGGKRPVLFLEADLYNPTLIQRFGLQPGPGLAHCLEANLDPLRALRYLTTLGWYCLPAGSAKGNPTELLQSERFGRVMERLSHRFEWIIVDTPPVAPLSDAVSLLQHVDSSLLVVRAGQTPQDAVKQAIELLGRKRVAGIVFNGAERLNRLYSDYYGHYAKK